ncbi:uncharacterized protein EV422DRAFT_547286 [Fimicolochytrium jonesii]|uniref:uncharacterized protein n=1 Tax=Fimicolochytrium jonesii TaxID=1396493 RepID=UPI0022FF3552|nr:uncharacterized protein EV422DRAFT_547286 [Fimicolochytrium jonesii]KAI8816089.1 hypothetical protein EV422DRAFT_547286 [Fimicolochytrium jonesii]
MATFEQQYNMEESPYPVPDIAGDSSIYTSPTDTIESGDYFDTSLLFPADTAAQLGGEARRLSFDAAMYSVGGYQHLAGSDSPGAEPQNGAVPYRSLPRPPRSPSAALSNGSHHPSQHSLKRTPSFVSDHISDTSSVRSNPYPQRAAPLRCLWRLEDESLCSRPFTDPELLYSHLTEDHVGRKTTGNLTLQCRVLNCTHAVQDQAFTKRDHITSHLRSHVPLKANPCVTCAKSFKWPHDLKKHYAKTGHGNAGAVGDEGGVGQFLDAPPATRSLGRRTSKSGSVGRPPRRAATSPARVPGGSAALRRRSTEPIKPGSASPRGSPALSPDTNGTPQGVPVPSQNNDMNGVDISSSYVTAHSFGNTSFSISEHQSEGHFSPGDMGQQQVDPFSFMQYRTNSSSSFHSIYSSSSVGGDTHSELSAFDELASIHTTESYNQAAAAAAANAGNGTVEGYNPVDVHLLSRFLEEISLPQYSTGAVGDQYPLPQTPDLNNPSYATGTDFFGNANGDLDSFFAASPSNGPTSDAEMFGLVGAGGGTRIAPASPYFTGFDNGNFDNANQQQFAGSSLQGQQPYGYGLPDGPAIPLLSISQADEDSALFFPPGGPDYSDLSQQQQQQQQEQSVAGEFVTDLFANGIGDDGGYYSATSLPRPSSSTTDPPANTNTPHIFVTQDTSPFQTQFLHRQQQQQHTSRPVTPQDVLAELTDFDNEFTVRAGSSSQFPPRPASAIPVLFRPTGDGNTYGDTPTPHDTHLPFDAFFDDPAGMGHLNEDGDGVGMYTTLSSSAPTSRAGTGAKFLQEAFESRNHPPPQAHHNHNNATGDPTNRIHQEIHAALLNMHHGDNDRTLRISPARGGL